MWFRASVRWLLVDARRIEVLTGRLTVILVRFLFIFLALTQPRGFRHENQAFIFVKEPVTSPLCSTVSMNRGTSL